MPDFYRASAVGTANEGKLRRISGGGWSCLACEPLTEGRARERSDTPLHDACNSAPNE